jgi:secondary thiamine-phosphate synthase enzyme
VFICLIYDVIMIVQKIITLPEYRRGFHLITSSIEKQLPGLPSKGLLNLFIQHTSAGLTINENADPSVRDDFKSFINRLVPDADRIFSHTLEGDDDMAAHIKSSLFGLSLTIPISNNRLCLGTWQGIYLCEFRDHGGQRSIIITITGE